MKESLREIDKFSGKCLLILLGFAVSISGAFALSSEASPELLTQRAELIIRGEVKAKITEERSYIAGTTDGTTVTYQTVETILTDYEVVLEKSYKQVISRSVISILTLGGFLSDGRGWTHSKYFELDVGDKFIAFLVYDKRNEAWRIYAGSQGIFKIVEDTSNLECPIVVSAYTGHIVASSSSLPNDRDYDSKLSLQELMDIIKKGVKK